MYEINASSSASYTGKALKNQKPVARPPSCPAAVRQLCYERGMAMPMQQLIDAVAYYDQNVEHIDWDTVPVGTVEGFKLALAEREEIE